MFVVAAGVGLFMFATYSGSGSAGAVPVTVWGTLPRAAFDAVTGQSEKGSALSLVTYVEKRPESFAAEYINAAASGSSPDLIVLPSDQLTALQHTLSSISYESVTERGFRDTFIDGTHTLLAPDGIRGIPLVVDPLVLYYNRSLLSSAGVAEAPRTWEAVGAMVPQLAVVANQQVITRAGIALGGYANIEHAREILTAFFLQAGVSFPRSLAPGQRSSFFTELNSSGIPPAESALRYYTAFANPAQTTYSWNSALPNSRSLFLSGDLALYIGFGSEYAALKQANPNLDFDVARMPQPGNAAVRSTYGNIYVLALPKASSNVAGALTTAFALVSGDAAKTFVAATPHLASTRRDVVSLPTSDPVQVVVNAEALIARSWLSPDAGAVDAVFGAMISSVISGRARVLDALSVAERAISAAYPQ